MSTTKRLAAGQKATIANFLVGVLTQIIAIPVLLSRWSQAEYGIWFAIQAAVMLLSIFDYGLLDYVQFEALEQGKDRPRSIARLLGAAMPMGVIFGTGEFLIALIIVVTGAQYQIFGLPAHSSHRLIVGAGAAFLLSTLWSSIFMSVASYTSRVLPVFGQYARVVWWNLAVTFLGTVAACVAVRFGADLMMAALAQFITMSVISTFQTINAFQILRQHGVEVRRIYPRFGWLLMKRVRMGMVKNMLEQYRQQGIRVIISATSGANAVGVFTPTRTLANVVNQASTTVVGPVTPELASCIAVRDERRIHACFSGIYAMLAAFFMPCAFVIQGVAHRLIQILSHGKIPLDPWLMATLLLGSIFPFASFPANTVLRSQNDFGRLTKIASVSAIMVVAIVVATSWILGVLGAGIAVLVGEGLAFILIQIFSKKMMRELGLAWPKDSIAYCNLTIVAGAVILGLMAAFPAKGLVIGIGGFIPSWLLAAQLWKTLPADIRKKMPIRRGARA